MPRLEEHCWSCSCSTNVKSKDLSSASWIASKLSEMMSILTSMLSHVYRSLYSVHSTNLIRRGLVLFTVGVLLALVLNLLQIQRNVTLFPEGVMDTLFSSAWWIPLCCGTAAAVVGLLYPFLDSHLGEPHKFKREWASVMRCIAVFVGINHASAKLDFANNVQLSLTLAALSLGLWWTFDRSRSGFGLGLTTALLATLVAQFLVYNGIYQYTSPDFLYVRSWLPCIFFSGGVTVGNIGRQLAMGSNEKPHND
ncbi:insulin-induced gene 1 protein [Chanos chanos]|uniref:Insulin-induced gene protein n=1 Tax=Chanos chanos TaxID=29144 RepID=A0A6J2VVP3_CHACN|nr:insulin-induced gene 1 protein [Chanos chanos]